MIPRPLDGKALGTFERLRWASFEDPIYQADIFVVWGGDKAMLGRLVRARRPNFRPAREDFFENDADGSSFFTTSSDGVFEYWIWLRTQDLGVAVHECVHLAHFILDHVGLRLTHDSVEAYTYFIEAAFAMVRGAMLAGRKMKRGRRPRSRSR